MPRSPGSDARGQAELVGYVLVFSAIVLTVGLVTISGQAGLVDLRDSQRTAGVAEGFSILADNVDDILRRGVPSRATELGLSGGSISLGEPVTVTVRARASDSGVPVFERSQTLRPIVYESASGATLVYASGAVILRGEAGGVTMLRDPRLVLDSTRTIVPVANTTLDRRQPSRSVSVDGDSRVLVRTERTARARLSSTDEEVDLRIVVDSPRAAAWNRYLEREIGPGGDCSTAGGTVSCTYTTDSATVVETRIAVSFE